MKHWKVVILVAAIAIVPLVPYMLLGYANISDDFRFHVTSWIDMKDAWLGGQMIPGWAAKANFTLGDPHLALYPPVSLILGGLLCLLLPISIAPAAFVWLALVAAGLAMYLASEPFLSEDDRISAGVIYMLSPYMLTSALVRFAAAELLVLALLPLILLWFYRSVWQTDRRGSSCLRLGTTINEAGLAPDAGRRAGSMPGSFSLVANMVRAEVVESEWP